MASLTDLRFPFFPPIFGRKHNKFPLYRLCVFYLFPFSLVFRWSPRSHALLISCFTTMFPLLIVNVFQKEVRDNLNFPSFPLIHFSQPGDRLSFSFFLSFLSVTFVSVISHDFLFFNCIFCVLTSSLPSSSTSFFLLAFFTQADSITKLASQHFLFF